MAHFIPLEAEDHSSLPTLRCLKNQAILLSYDLMSSSGSLLKLEVLYKPYVRAIVFRDGGTSEKMIERLQQDFSFVSANQIRASD